MKTGKLTRQIVYTLAFLSLTSCKSNSNKQEAQQKSNSVEKEITVGERIDGPANIRESRNGKILFKLNDQTQVQTGRVEDGWLPVGLWIEVNKEQENSFQLLPGEEIRQSGIVVGEVIDTTGLWTADDGVGFLAGMTFKDNIIKSTIPEVYLSSLIEQRKIAYKELRPFMNAMSFELDDSWIKKDIKAFFIYEEFIVDPSPMDRISLLFKQGKLVAVNHSREMSLPGFITLQLDRNYKLTIIGELTDNEIKELVEERNHWLNSVD